MVCTWLNREYYNSAKECHGFQVSYLRRVDIAGTCLYGPNRVRRGVVFQPLESEDRSTSTGIHTRTAPINRYVSYPAQTLITRSENTGLAFFFRAPSQRRFRGNQTAQTLAQRRTDTGVGDGYRIGLRRAGGAGG